MKLFSKFLVPICFSCSLKAVYDDIDTDDSKSPIKIFPSTQIKSIVSHSSVIAQGGFSTIFLAKVDNSLAAIKVHEPSVRLYQMFQQELKVLLQTNHRNIVRLIGYSDDISEITGVLIIEHVPNGTLHDFLHTNLVLAWRQRLSIAYQLALALHYLHEECDVQIIHGDIKSSNVLLDGNSNPKLCDFGSSKMGFSGTVNPSGNPIMGSIGYVDPYYLRTGLVSKKSDVYSFGLLILEIVTGIEAFSIMRIKKMGEIKVDERIRDEHDEGELRVLVDIAEQCIVENPSLRPSMGEVLRIMREKMPSWIRCC